MIPVAAVLHYKNPGLTEAMLRSFPRDLARQFVIVDNSECGTAPRTVDGVPFEARYITFMGNMGVAHGWNTVIKATPRAEWWAIFNNDLEVERGDIERLITAMGHHDLVLMGGFDAFAVHRRVIGQIGWFDENYHPAYCEDNDFTHRAVLAEVSIANIDAVKLHHGSATIMRDPELRERNQATFANNVEYHQAKWGGLMGHEIYTRPFNKAEGPAVGRLSIERLSSQHWESARE